MKKKETKDQKDRKQHRLSLNRETLLVLNNPALLELVKGGATHSTLTGCGNEE